MGFSSRLFSPSGIDTFAVAAHVQASPGAHQQSALDALITNLSTSGSRKGIRQFDDQVHFDCLEDLVEERTSRYKQKPNQHSFKPPPHKPQTYSPISAGYTLSVFQKPTPNLSKTALPNPLFRNHCFGTILPYIHSFGRASSNRFMGRFRMGCF